MRLKLQHHATSHFFGKFFPHASIKNDMLAISGLKQDFRRWWHLPVSLRPISQRQEDQGLEQKTHAVPCPLRLHRLGALDSATSCRTTISRENCVHENGIHLYMLHRNMPCGKCKKSPTPHSLEMVSINPPNLGLCFCMSII